MSVAFLVMPLTLGERGTCQKIVTLTTISYAVSAIQMVTDWASAILPWFIVAGLQMPHRRKIAIVFILGLGIFASIAIGTPPNTPITSFVSLPRTATAFSHKFCQVHRVDGLTTGTFCPATQIMSPTLRYVLTSNAALDSLLVPCRH